MVGVADMVTPFTLSVVVRQWRRIVSSLEEKLMNLDFESESTVLYLSVKSI